MNDELRVDHHAESGDGIVHFFFSMSLRVGEHGMYLTENLDKIFTFLLVAL